MNIRYQMHGRHMRYATFHLLHAIATCRQFYKTLQGVGYQLGYTSITGRQEESSSGDPTAGRTRKVARIVTLWQQENAWSRKNITCSIGLCRKSCIDTLASLEAFFVSEIGVYCHCEGA